MPSSFSKGFLDRLFIIIPELRFDAEFLRENEALLIKSGIITKEVIDWVEAQELQGSRILHDLEGKRDFVRKLRGKTLIERILMIAPEIISSSSVDLLRSLGLVDAKTAHALRIALAAKSALAPVLKDRRFTQARSWDLFDAIFSHETVNLLKNLEDERIQFVKNAYLKMRGWDRMPPFQKYPFEWRLWVENAITTAQRARSVISVARLVRQTVKEAKAADSVWDVMTVILQNSLSDRVLANAQRLGVISAEKRAVIKDLERYGLGIWKAVGQSFEYNSWAARALIISEKIIDHALLEALYKAKIISPELRALMSPAVTGIRRILRTNSDLYRKSSRIRLDPSKSPLFTYLRKTEATDRALLQLLADAANESRITALKFGKGGVGKVTISRQQRLVQRELHKQMRILNENAGHLIIFGEKEAKLAAEEAMDFLENRMWGSSKAMQDLRRMIQLQARSGVESFASRGENMHRLSGRVYKNWKLATGQVDDAISRALLRDLSAKDFAKTVEDLIKPDVPGGISYASMRLARTEINNAFHFTQIRYTRETPWVQGYKWHLSGSHGKPDVCNDYADNDSYNMGKGVFPKSDVPGKPHPQCLCFITSETMSNGDFEKALLRGNFDQYLKTLSKSDYGETAWKVPDANTMARLGTSFDTALKAVAVGYASRQLGRIWKIVAPPKGWQPFDLGWDE